MRGAEDLPPTHVDAAEVMDGAAAKQEVAPTGPAHRRARIRRPTEGRRMATDGSEPQEQEGDRLGPPLVSSISSDPAWVPRAPTPPASGGKSVGFSASAKEEERAKEEGTAEEEEEVAAAEIGADARVSAAAALEVLPERAAAEKAVEVEMVGEATEAEAAAAAADEAEAKREVVGEAAVKEAEKEAEMAQEVDGTDVLPDDLWSAGCAA